VCVTLPGVPEIFSELPSPQLTVALYPLPSVGKTNVSDALPDCVVSTTNWNPANTAGDDEGVGVIVGVGDGLGNAGDSLGVGVILGVGVTDDVGVIDGVVDDVGVGVGDGQTDGYEIYLPVLQEPDSG